MEKLTFERKQSFKDIATLKQYFHIVRPDHQTESLSFIMTNSFQNRTEIQNSDRSQGKFPEIFLR